MVGEISCGKEMSSLGGVLSTMWYCGELSLSNNVRGVEEGVESAKEENMMGRDIINRWKTGRVLEQALRAISFSLVLCKTAL